MHDGQEALFWSIGGVEGVGDVVLRPLRVFTSLGSLNCVSKSDSPPVERCMASIGSGHKHSVVLVAIDTARAIVRR